MRKILSRLCAMILVFAIVTTSSGVEAFAEYVSESERNVDCKIVEQIKEDLGEEKANEILQVNDESKKINDINFDSSINLRNESEKLVEEKKLVEEPIDLLDNEIKKDEIVENKFNSKSQSGYANEDIYNTKELNEPNEFEEEITLDYEEEPEEDVVENEEEQEKPVETEKFEEEIELDFEEEPEENVVENEETESKIGYKNIEETNNEFNDNFEEPSYEDEINNAYLVESDEKLEDTAKCLDIDVKIKNETDEELNDYIEDLNEIENEENFENVDNSDIQKNEANDILENENIDINDKNNEDVLDNSDTNNKQPDSNFDKKKLDYDDDINKYDNNEKVDDTESVNAINEQNGKYSSNSYIEESGGIENVENADDKNIKEDIIQNLDSANKNILDTNKINNDKKLDNNEKNIENNDNKLEKNANENFNVEVSTATNSNVNEKNEDELILSFDDEIATQSIINKTNDEKILKGGVIHTLSFGWFRGAGIDKKDITKILVQKGGDVPSGTSYFINRSTGLKGYLNGTEITIYTPNNDDIINLNTEFNEFSSLISIDANSFETSSITSMYRMFSGCSSLTSVDVSNWNTSSVTNMWDMFRGCNSLTSVDVSNWNTSSVTDMMMLFEDCKSLTSIDVSNWNTSSVTNMREMFRGCNSLTSVDVSNWNTSSVTNMGYMFSDCSSLTNLDINHFSTSNVTDMMMMFENCKCLTSINISSWDTSSVIYMLFMFSGCISLTSVDISNWNTSSVTDMSSMFSGCSSLTSIDVSNWNTSSVTNMGFMFESCSSLTSLDLSGWNTCLVIYMGHMFSNCSSLTNLDINHFSTSNVTNMMMMFDGCKKLTSLDVSNWNTSSVTSMSSMFSGCSKLTSIDLSGWNTCLVTDMSSMFYDCNEITEIDLSSFYTNSLINCSSIFYSCNNLERVDLSHFNISNISTNIDIFRYCHNIKDINISTSIASVINNLYLEHDWKDYAGPNIYLYDKVNSKTTLPNTAGRYVIYESGLRFTVTFNSNGGSYVKSIMVNNGDTILEPTSPTKTGFEFSGWYSEDLLITPFVFSTPITKNITLYAKFDRVPPIYWYISNGNTLHISGTEPISSDYISGQMFYSISSTNGHPWTSKKNNIVTIEIDNLIKPLNCRYLFAKHENLTTIVGINNINTSNSKNMLGMFYGCKALTEIDISSFDISKVTSMQDMFYECGSLHNINLTGINTCNVTSFKRMFYKCKLLGSINLSNFDNSKLIDMSRMFESCEKLSSINLSNFNTSNVTNMSSMFRNCYKLVTIDVSSFNTSKVTDMSLMFECRRYQQGQESLLQNIIGLNNFDTNMVVDMHGMFYGDKNLTSLDVSSFNTSKVQDMSEMFSNCSSLKKLDLRNFDTSNVRGTNGHGSFVGGEPLDGMSHMFFDCSSLESLNISSFNTINVNNMSSMFYGCGSLSILDVSGFDTSNVIYMNGIFMNCGKVSSLDVSKFETSKVKDMSYMFCGCGSLTSIDVSNWNTSQVTNMSSMFSRCVSLTNIDVSGFNTSNVVDMNYMFCDCRLLTNIDVSRFNTCKVTNMESMFSGCGITALDLSCFDTSKVTNMSYMFYFCESIRTIYVSERFNTLNVNKSDYMFSECNNLVGEYCTHYDINHINKEYARIDTLLTPGYFTYKEPQIYTYVITFDTNGGSFIDRIIVNEGEKTTKPTNPTKTGYVFVNWYKDSELTNLWNFDVDIVNSNITLYAKWKQVENLYTVTFETNGGSAITSLNVNSGAKIARPENPTKAGYTFENWYKDSTLNIIWNFNVDVVTSDITLYAKWKAASIKQYYVTFNTNGGSAISPLKVEEGEKIVKPINPTKNKNIFVNWYKDKKFKNVWDFDNDVVTADITLYAKWKIGTEWTIIFDANGGTGTMDNITQVANTNVTLPYNTFTKTGCTFVNWKDNDGNTYNDGAVIKIIKNITLYAVWKEGNITKWSITFNTNGGKVINNIIIANGEKIIKPLNPIKTGYKFENWYKESALTNIWNFNTDIVTSDITLYAKWSKNKTVTTGGGGGGGGGSSRNKSKGSISKEQQVFNKLLNKSNAKVFGARNNQNEVNIDSNKVSWIRNLDETWELNTNGNIEKPINKFVSIKNANNISNVYYFDERGIMVTGWFKDTNNNFYFFEIEKNDNEGSMATGWKKINWEYYYFDNDGKLFVNGMTPDGYLVDAEGKYVESNEAIVLDNKLVKVINMNDVTSETHNTHSNGNNSSVIEVGSNAFINIELNGPSAKTNNKNKNLNTIETSGPALN